MPPLSSSRSYIDLLTAIAATAVETSTPIAIEGYPPPTNSDITGFQITPDPGVIEVNIHPANTWSDLVKQTKVVYDAASTCGLTAWKYTLNGHTASTGGGAHITIGGPTATASPLLRRPDLLRSLLGYWQNHPSLSYVFAGLFVGPTSQSPRLDESRLETLNELDIAFQYLRPGHPTSATTIDSLLSDLLVDCSGNAHRTALCIDKLWPQHNPRLQLGLLEFRGFSMPPNAWMRLVQLVLVRSLVAMVWDRPYTAPLIRWGTQLHDRFLLPQVIHQDLQAVLADLADAGFQLESSWFEPFLSLRFPSLGVVQLEARDGYPIALELRRAIEPWNVTGNALEHSGTSRTVDASLERLQVSLSSDQMLKSVDVTCNGYRVPLIEASSDRGSGHIKVGGVRWRARSKTPTPHPATAPHTELRFEVVDRHQKRSLGGCTFFPTSTPIDSNLARPSSPTEAAFRIANAFRCHPPHNTPCQITETPISAEYPSLLDLRYCR